MQILTKVVDLGFSGNVIKPVEFCFVNGPLPLPSNELIQSDVLERGRFGFINHDSKDWADYEKLIQTQIIELSYKNVIIVIPEFGGFLELETWASTELCKKNRRCFLVGGSYYAKNREKIESRCPIITPDGNIYYQKKFIPSPLEKKFGCDEPDQQLLYIIHNTSFGDFSVLICSDALRDRSEEVLTTLRGRIDLLIVVARNGSSDLPNALKEMARNEGWVIAYCNGGSGDSAVYTPEKQRNPIPKFKLRAKVNVRKIHRLT